MSIYKELPAPQDMVHRYTDIPLPPYRYVPRLHRHPLSVDGYLSQRKPVYTCFGEQFCYGVDLHNHLYFWEAHEVWEGLWKDVALDGETKNMALSRFLQACIVLSGCHFTAHLGRIQIAQEMLCKVQHWLEEEHVATQRVTMDDSTSLVVDVSTLQGDMQRFAHALAGLPVYSSPSDTTIANIESIRVQIHMISAKITGA